MDEASITRFITDTLEGVEAVVAPGNTFFIPDPDRRLPFATLVTDDDYDSISRLNHPSVFRLNIGDGRETYTSLLGPPSSSADAGGIAEAGQDFTPLDPLLPHPIHAPQSWVCILDPTDETFREAVLPLLAEAHERAPRGHTRQTRRE